MSGSHPTVTDERSMAERVRERLEALGHSTTDPYQEQVKAWQQQAAAQAAATRHQQEATQ